MSSPSDASDAIDSIRLRHLSERHMRAMRDVEYDLARERLTRRLLRDLAARRGGRKA